MGGFRNFVSLIEWEVVAEEKVEEDLDFGDSSYQIEEDTKGWEEVGLTQKPNPWH